MNWSSQILQYCERGSDVSLWAEPLNALSNGAFVLAALLVLRQPRRGALSSYQVAMIWLAALIGVGSFLFHTFATRWAMLADVGAIVSFTFAYLAYVLRNHLGLGRRGVAAGLVSITALLFLARLLPCEPALLPTTAASGRPCLNGSLGYLPVLAALTVVGLALNLRRHVSARSILWAAGLFAVSLLVRTLDIEWCSSTEILGAVRGTHALWHVLNATVVYLLLRAATDVGK